MATRLWFSEVLIEDGEERITAAMIVVRVRDDDGSKGYFYDEVPWCLGGDFNIVRCVEEKIGLSYNQRAMECFSEFIEGLGLIDLPLGRGSDSDSWVKFRDLKYEIKAYATEVGQVDT
ncbi:hypothetical protein PTKIN_Ptkin03bG0142700 [Pterospermum kingtungense]